MKGASNIFARSKRSNNPRSNSLRRAVFAPCVATVYSSSLATTCLRQQQQQQQQQGQRPDSTTDPRNSVAFHFSTSTGPYRGTPGVSNRNHRSQLTSVQERTKERGYNSKNSHKSREPRYLLPNKIAEKGQRRNEKDDKWVPQAYRGAANSGRDYSNQNQKKTETTQKDSVSRMGGKSTPRARGKWHVHTVENELLPDEQKSSWEAVRKHAFRIGKKVEQYKRMLIGGPALATVARESSLTANTPLIEVYQKLSQQLESIHHVETSNLSPDETGRISVSDDSKITAVHFAYVLNTETPFSEVCDLLRELVPLSANALYWESESDDAQLKELKEPTTEDEVFVPIDMAIMAVDALAKFRSERNEIVSASHKKLEESTTEDTSLVKLVKESIFKVLPFWEPPKPKKDDNFMSTFAHCSPRLDSSLDLYRQILDALLKPKRGSVGSASPYLWPDSAQEKAAIFRMNASRRCIYVLRDIARMAKNSAYQCFDSARKLDIVEFLSKSGTFEGASWAKDIVQTMPNHALAPNSHLQRGDPELLPWHAYVGVAHNKKCPTTERVQAVRDLFKLWEKRWIIGPSPTQPNEILHNSLLMLSAVTAIGDEIDDQIEVEFNSFVESVQALYLGTSGYEIFKGELDAAVDPRDFMKGKWDIGFLNALAKAFSCLDVRKSRFLIRALLTEQEGSFITVDTINCYFRGLLLDREKGRTRSADLRNDVDFVVSLLRISMMRKTWDHQYGIATPETFEMSSMLLTLACPPKVGEYFLKWMLYYEIRCSLGFTREIKTADYNRVLWGLWQQAKQAGKQAGKQATSEADENLSPRSETDTEADKNPSPRSETDAEADERQFSCFQRACDVLFKMDTMSTPLLLSPKEVLKSSTKISPYNAHVRPSKSTFELVLKIAADTTETPEFEGGTELLLEVLELAQRRGIELDKAIVDRCIHAFSLEWGKDSEETNSSPIEITL